MKRIIRETEDGSKTIYIEDWDETYHSIHGAVQEASHVFIQNGFHHFVENKLPVKIIVLNNKTLGMIRQFQDSYFESRYQSTYWGYDAPDFAKVAIAYGIEAKTIENSNEIENAVDWLWSNGNENKPQLLQVMVDPHTNTYPKIAFGRPITEMEPFAKPIAMEAT